jgi:hypothetical protein
MTDAGDGRPSRRSVLAGGGLLLLAACTGSSPPRAPQLTADQRLARRVAAEITVLVGAYAATISAHPRTRPALASLAAEHDAHLAALTALQPAPAATPSASSSGSTAPSPSASPSAVAVQVAPSPAAARAALARAEKAAAARRRQQAGDAGPDLARLIASIAACEAVHAILVAP